MKIYQNATWVVHSDTSHAGRQAFRLTRYNGPVAEEINELYASYWDSDSYDENSEFSYRGEEISMMEYEALRKEFIGW